MGRVPEGEIFNLRSQTVESSHTQATTKAGVLPRVLLFSATVLCLFPPVVGAYFRWGGFPPGFGVFPPQIPVNDSGVAIPTPGFNLFYFAVFATAALIILTFLLFPRLFGFQRVEPIIETSPAESVAIPWWFYVGALVNLSCWSTMWFSTSQAVNYVFTPMWWGFISVIDGIVYRRTGGRSMMSSEPRRMISVTIASENWIYPYSPKIFTQNEAYFWFTLCYSCILPAIFEWYTLLNTFPRLTSTWANGPKLHLNNYILCFILAGGVTIGCAVGYFPFPLFFVVWIGSLLVLPTIMGLLGLWSPFTNISSGNWTPLVLIALSGLINGIFWEFWNFGSDYFIPGRNPNYWVYDIPYVDVLHVFSEMPILGYFGYLPFGAQAWTWWLVAAHIFNYDPEFNI